MPFITTRDGTNIFFNDFGSGPTVLFSHGWPLSGDDWERQMLFLGERGYRVIAHDRRSHGRSDQTWDGNDMDHYADDLADVITGLDLKDIVLIGHSTGGGEITHYMGRHGTGRVKKAVLLGAVPPVMVKSESNPGGTPIEAFDGIRAGTRADRSQFYYDLTIPFYGYNRPGAKVSEGVREAFRISGLKGGLKGQLDCIHEFSEVDFTPDLQRIEIPVLVAHGDDDQIVPIGNSAMLSSKILKNATLKVFPGGCHGFAATNADELNAVLLEFIQG